jgi:hypothetical protein
LLKLTTSASTHLFPYSSSQKLSRIPAEQYHPDVIEQQYNNYSEAMFWGCFLYDYKGPCHIYYKETEEQKEAYKELM